MTITSFAELKSAIDDFLNRDDLATISKTFIQLAESRLNRSLRHWRMEKRVTNTLDAQYEALPSDWLETIRIDIQNERQLELASYAEIIEKRRQFSDTSGEPRLYAHVAGNFEVWPTPDGDYTVELLYYSEIPALSSVQTTNWLLERFPDLYLYGALIHSAPYLSEDPRIDVWGALYRSALDEANADRPEHSGTGLRLRRRGLS